MSLALLSLLVFSTTLLAAGKPDREPLEVLKTDGTFALDDGSSYFVFSRDGSFHSFPHGICGRCFDGFFKTQGTDGIEFVATGQQTWMNGGFTPGDYRKIVFSIYPGQLAPAESPCYSGHETPKQIWKGYWIIAEIDPIRSVVTPEELAQIKRLIGGVPRTPQTQPTTPSFAEPHAPHGTPGTLYTLTGLTSLSPITDVTVTPEVHSDQIPIPGPSTLASLLAASLPIDPKIP